MRVGKHDPRHRRVVIAHRLQPQRIVDRDLGTIGGHIDKLVPVGNIARGPNTGPCGGHVRIDLDRAACVGLDAKLFQTKVLGIGNPAGGHNQPFGGQNLGLTIPFDSQSDAARRFRNRDVGKSGLDRDAFGLQRLRKCLGHLWFGAGQKTGTGYQRDLRSQPRGHLRQFAADIAAAQHHDAVGPVGQAQKAPGIKCFHGVDTLDRGHVRARAGGDQDARGGNDPLGDSDATLDQSRRTLLDICKVLIGGQQVDIFLVPHLLDQIGAAFHHGGPIHGMFTWRDTGESGSGPATMHRIGGADHRLGGNAADIDAGATDRAVPDERHPLSGLSGGDGGGEAGRAGPNHDQVVAVAAGVLGRAAIMRLDGLVHGHFLFSDNRRRCRGPVKTRLTPSTRCRRRSSDRRKSTP